MKERKEVLAAGLAALLLLAACSAQPGSVDSVIDDAAAAGIEQAEDVTGTTLGSDSAEAIAKLQTSLDVVSAEMAEADLPDDLTVVWDEIQVRVNEAVVSIQGDPNFDPTSIDLMLDTFQVQLETMDMASDFESAWVEFRADFEAFVEAHTG